jgi:hypothetical protein
MANHQLLDNVTHKDTKVNRAFHPQFGDNDSYSQVFVQELRLAQVDYPLFFRKNSQTDKFEMIAMFGFAEQENLFLDVSGWHASYVPMSIRRRPFLIGFQEQVIDGVAQDNVVVHIDMDSPRVSTTSGEPIFLPQGGQSEYLIEMSEVLGGVHNGHQDNEQFIEALLALSLIESVEIKVELDDGSKNELQGLYTINEEAFLALDNLDFLSLNGKGYVEAIYMLLASTGNLSHLIKRKNATLGL